MEEISLSDRIDAACVALIDQLHSARSIAMPPEKIDSAVSSLLQLISSPPALEEYRWSCLQSLLFAHLVPRSVRQKWLQEFALSNLRESYMCLLEVWDGWVTECSTADEAEMGLELCSTMQIAACTSLTSKRALDVVSGLYQAMHQVTMSRWPNRGSEHGSTT